MVILLNLHFLCGNMIVITGDYRAEFLSLGFHVICVVMIWNIARWLSCSVKLINHQWYVPLEGNFSWFVLPVYGLWFYFCHCLQILFMIVVSFIAGKIQKNLEVDEEFKTPLQQKLDEFGHQLSKVRRILLRVWLE